MTDLKITMNAYAVIERKKFWDGNYDWQTINTLMIPEKERKYFFVDTNTFKLEYKLVQGLTDLDFLPVITRVKTSYDLSKDKDSLEQLKDILSDIYVELQDVKANIDDDELKEFVEHIDAELVSAAKIVAAMKEIKPKSIWGRKNEY